MALRLLVSFHLVGVVLWMGGLLNLSRVLGYHAREHPSVRPRYSYLEGRLNYLVTVPGAFLTLGTGLAQTILLGPAEFHAARWLHYKLGLVAAIFIIHVVTTRRQRAIAIAAADAHVPRALFAALHGTLGLLMIGVILLAVIKRPVLPLP